MKNDTTHEFRVRARGMTLAGASAHERDRAHDQAMFYALGHLDVGEPLVTVEEKINGRWKCVARLVPDEGEEE